MLPRPALFKEIANQWPNGSPSDENLKAWLIRRQFAADAVQDVIKAYRDTMDLVAREAGAYDSPHPKPDTPAPKMPQPQQQSPNAPPTLPSAGSDPYYFTFKPSVGFEGGFRLNSRKDFDDFILLLGSFKTLFEPVESFLRPEGWSDDNDEG